MTMCWNENTQEDDGYYVDTANARHGVAIMRNASKSSQPFFIAVGIHRPHLPWDVPAHYYSLYIDVSTKDNKFMTKPAYVTSVAGKAHHLTITGGASVFRASAACRA